MRRVWVRTFLGMGVGVVVSRGGDVGREGSI